MSARTAVPGTLRFGGAAIALACLVMTTAIRADENPPPVAKRIPHPDTTLGDVRSDDYYWLRDRKNPEVIAYLEAENRHTEAALKPTAALQETLFREMVGRIRETDLTVPVRDGDYFYYARTEQGKQYPIQCRKHGSLEAPEEVILDINALAEGHGFLHVGAAQHSPDHKLLAYTVDTNGSESYTLYVKDLVAGTLLPDQVVGVQDVVEWGNDNRTLFYVVEDSARRPYQIKRHVLGADAARDPVLVQENDELFDLRLEKSRDRGWLLAASESFSSAEVRVLDANHPDGSFQVVRPRTRDVLYSIAPHGPEFFILTNEGATNFKVMRAGARPGAWAHWEPFIAHRDSVLIDGLDPFRDHLTLYTRRSGLRQIEIRNLATGATHEVAFPDPVYTYNATSNPDYEATELRLNYSSLVTPPTVFDYGMETRTFTMKKRTEVPGYDPALYRTERVWATAADGARVPISLLYRAPLARDGRRPMLLYGYGAYGITSEPSFNPNLFSLVDRGYVYAIAHIRGGREMGRPWYDDGKLLHKKNTFTDFIACAEALVRDRTTASDRLAIRGGSAGGLLMGAVLNMRPDLFRAAIADVPFVDLINTMKDASIPLTTQEWEQWGDPRTATYYGYMKSYSPYDNVARQRYPALLVTGGLNDPRVGYWEPTKWVAKLRATKTDSHTLLLRVNMGAGHGGASGRYDNLREQAIRYAFLLHEIGGQPGGPAKAAAAP